MINTTYQNIGELIHKKETPYSIKNLVEDLTTGMSVIKLKDKYSSQFNLVDTFSRNWSWENRAKNIDSIVKQYLTIDDYVGIERVTEDNNIKQKNYSVYAQEEPDSSLSNNNNNNNNIIEELQTVYSTITSKVSKNKRIKNQESVLERLTQTSRYVDNTLESAISSYILRSKEKNDNINEYSETKITEQMTLPGFNNLKFYDNESTREPLRLRLEDRMLDHECEIIPFPNIVQQTIVEQYPRFSQKVQEIINYKKAQAEMEVKIWFSEMTKEKNPDKYLDAKIKRKLRFDGSVEKEIASEYIEKIRELVEEDCWKTVFGKKRSWFSRVGEIDLIEKVVTNYESQLGYEYSNKINNSELMNDKEIFENDNCREFELNSLKQKGSTWGSRLKRATAMSLLGTLIGTSAGSALVHNEVQNINSQIAVEQENYDIMQNRIKQVRGVGVTRTDNMSNYKTDQNNLTNESNVTLNSESNQASIINLDTDEIDQILYDDDLSLDTYYKAKRAVENGTGIVTIINEENNFFVIRSEDQEINNIKRKRLERVEGFNELTNRTQQNMINGYSLANNSLRSVLYATNSNGGSIEVAEIKDGRIERTVIEEKRTL